MILIKIHYCSLRFAVDEISPQFCDILQKLAKYISIITHRYKSQRNLQNFLQFETNRAEKNVFSGLPTPKIQYQPPTPPRHTYRPLGLPVLQELLEPLQVPPPSRIVERDLG